MHLNCPDCAHLIPSNDVNITKTIAVCTKCDNIFSFQEELTTAGLPVLVGQPSRLKEEIFQIPPGIEVMKLESMLEIMINWRRNAKYFLLFFAIYWNAFVLFFLGTIFMSGIGMEILAVSIFMIPFIGVGAYLLYKSIGQLFNTTYITVTEHSLTVEHKPFNFLIQKDEFYDKSDVEQLYVKRKSIGNTNGKNVYAYSVEMRLKNKKIYTLVRDLRSIEAAQFIEQEIENYIGITDQMMRGEWKENILVR